MLKDKVEKKLIEKNNKKITWVNMINLQNWRLESWDMDNSISIENKSK
jgi:hypothetical protein